MTYDHRILPRYRQPPIHHEHHNARQIHKAETQPEPIHVSKLPGDPQALRGIPAIGRGVTGAITGTRPEDALTLTTSAIRPA